MLESGIFKQGCPFLSQFSIGEDMSMNNIPRQQLYQLIATYGPSLCDDPRRCEALLKDLCAQYRPEVSVLIGALKEKVAAELLASQKNMPQTVLLARLTKRIRENLALTEDAARWAVESWALALGVISNTDESEPKPEPSEKTVSLSAAIGVNTPQATVLSPSKPQISTSLVKPKQRRLLIRASITTIAISALAVYALYRQPGASTQASLEQIKMRIAEGKYQECVEQATAIPQNSRIYTEAQTLLQQCQLSLAKQLAANNNFAVAITEAAKIPQNSVGYQEAQQRISQWSDNILEMAKHRYQLGNLSDAIAIAKTIPESSSVYPKAQKTIQQWNKEWQQNQSYLQAAQKALNEGKWQTAISEANKVTDNPYWRKQIEPINQKAKSQIEAPKRSQVRQSQPPRKQPELPAPQNPPPISPQPRPRPPQLQPRKPFQNQPRPQPLGITPPSSLPPKAQEILCKQFPLNSRCVGRHP